METFLMLLLTLTGVFLILLVLIQRGRGGGLAGAFGGAGGQSAFGAKSGDVFTRVTIGAAAVWIILCLVSVKILGTSASKFSSTLGPAAATEEVPGAAGGNADDKTPGATGKRGSTTTPAESQPASSTTGEAPAASKTASPPVEQPAAEAPATDTSK